MKRMSILFNQKKFFSTVLWFIIIISVTNTGCNKEKIDDALVGKNYLQFDGPYIFSSEHGYNVIRVNNNKEISNKIISDSIITIQSALNQEISFTIKIRNQSDIKVSEFETTNQVLAVSDLEGNFPLFIKFLESNYVINEKLEWVYGANHLVLAGDFFDRGPDVTALLWFIYKLEEEARQQGGMVHFILGNHEILNLSGDVSYTPNKYIALANELNIPFKALYNDNSVLGRWLRTKNTIEKINADIYCHGGISYQFAEKNISIDDANDLIRNNIGKNQSELCNADQDACFLYGRNGPLWYNGYFDPNGISVTQVEEVLQQFNAHKIIVGHSIVNEVKFVLNNRVIAIDAMRDEDPRNINENNLGNYCEGLLVEGGEYFKVSSEGIREKLLSNN